MKKFLTAVAAFSLTLTIAIIILPLPSFSASTPQVLSETKLNLSQYMDDKGTSVAKPETNFGKITEATPAGNTANPSVMKPFDSAQGKQSNNEAMTSGSSSATTNYQLPARQNSTQASAGGSTTNSNLTIALLGDSMIDTLGKDLPDLKQQLKSRFPKTKFTLFNYGAGATDLESGIKRLTDTTEYLGQTRPPLLSLNPNVLVIESFAYNHWNNTQSDLDRQWLDFAKIIDVIKTRKPQTKIILAATIAPYCPTYTDGSANLPPDRKYQECQTVIAYLKNLVNFANSQKLPLVNAYSASLKGNEGNPKYINQGDHIHPSETGKQLFSQKVAEAIERMIR